MNADTITIPRIAELFTLLDLAARSVSSLYVDSIAGAISPEDAAAEIREIMANLNASAK